ncbi:MAG: iron ABC transporter permease, partial [Acidimicrobiia bacterium]|nr:iron ABC transporter permease [Acidimicrobiia bacterium]
MSARATGIDGRPARPGAAAIVFGFATWTAACLAGLLLGPVSLPPGDTIRALLDALPVVSLDHGLTQTQLGILFEIRAPRVI